MKVVGLDLSYSATGIGVVGLRLLEAYVVHPPASDKASWGERVEIVLERVMHACKKADLAVIEGAAWNQIYAAYRLGKLSGAVELELFRAGIPYEYVPPSTIKKYATGNGRAKKEEMVTAAQQWIPDLQDDNAADALWMALWGLENYERLTKV